ncbi:hypothetical protein JR316_0006531 [Psilocybe cubensis]|uniref:F-box domain-containing protein n=2 Tax=Psilocybe cubensis TaxID=181762 RepID=A0A8H7XMT4_PSICU|nr:hypothetical protein JR316_0006531 [Psilocybe cubensis]KAH9482001.1 hypothetical protein JR316_0006531 [Psilocybe cubensis]
MSPRRNPKRNAREAFNKDTDVEKSIVSGMNEGHGKAQKPDESEQENIVPPSRATKKRRVKEVGSVDMQAESSSAIITANDTAPEKPCDIELPRAQLGSMPDELLCEIFSYTLPLDLLQLSHTCKSFRSFLMHTSARFIWKSARLNVPVPGLPDCPEDLNEAQYAALVFAPNCQFCFKKPVNRNFGEYVTSNIMTDFYARIKSCIPCLRNKKIFFPWKRGQGPWWNGPYPRTMAPYLPFVAAPKGTYNARITYKILHLPTNDAWAEEYRNAKSKAKWVEDKTRARKLAYVHSERCKVFMVEWNKHLVNERKAVVAKYVESLGWEEEFLKNWNPKLLIQNDPELQIIFQVDISQEWLDNTRDWFNLRMSKLKIERLDQERENRVIKAYIVLDDVLKNFALDLPPNALVPQVPDIIGYPAIQDIIHENQFNDNLSAKDFEPLRSVFPSIVAQSLQEREEKLLAIIAKELGEGMFDPKTILHLATTTFHCEICHEDILQYPRVLVHRHAYECRHPLQRKFGTDHIDEVILQNSVYRIFSWGKSGSITFRKEDVNTMSETLKMLGYDPKTTTRAEMDAADPILECEGCITTCLRSSNVGYQRMMRWSAVATHGDPRSTYHCRFSSARKNPMKLAKVDEETAKTVRSKLLQAINKFDNPHNALTYGYLMCSRCRKWGDMVTLSTHLKDVHMIDSPTEDDIVLRLDGDAPQICNMTVDLSD